MFPLVMAEPTLHRMAVCYESNIVEWPEIGNLGQRQERTKLMSLLADGQCFRLFKLHRESIPIVGPAGL